MSDLAQLLEDGEVEWALIFRDDVPEEVREALGRIVNRSNERLAQLEAGALIIVPDEKTVERIAEVIYQQVELHGVTYDRVAEAVLDALRDAKPDGET